MFYLSDKRGNKYGVTDTTDGITEYYTLQELVSFCNNDGIFIFGLNIEAERVELMSEVCAKLYELKEGMPLRIKYSENLPEKQVIYGGFHFDVVNKVTLFSFYDGSGVAKYFHFSANFLYNNKNIVRIDLNNNDEMEVARLLNLLGR